MAEKTCPECGRTFTTEELQCREDSVAWLRRRYCSKTCRLAQVRKRGWTSADKPADAKPSKKK